MNASAATATIVDSVVTGNDATRNWQSLNSLNRGGGLLNWAGTLTITNSTISDNEVRATDAIDPASGSGGGIANDLGDLVVSGSTVSGNAAICEQATPGDPDICGRGGGILNAGGDADVTNSTITGNTSDLVSSDHELYLGGGGGGGVAHMPGRTGGSVVTYYCPVTTIDSVTITENTAAHGGGVNTRWETYVGSMYDVEDWRVGYNENSQPILECPGLSVTNTIIAGNATTVTAGTEDSWGGFTSNGHNLVGDGTGAPSDGIGDITTNDPMLGPLADNGGATLTNALLKSSPAIDAGDTLLIADQRARSRPQGPADDIGAFESQPNLGRPVADFDGDGNTDHGVFRPETGGWWVFGQDTRYLGLSSDVPVPADYDGNGATDHAVFRPSSGSWYIEGQAPVYFGLSTDIPVPGDYDGNGTTDIAVYRPEFGGWYIEGQPTVFTGLSTDIPVPGDYDGNGTTDIAVYRPEFGGWYIEGQAPIYHGLSTDIPVPGDYDGNGTTDIAVYRPEFGGWYTEGQPTVFTGLSTDIPQPGDYDGNGTTDPTVYRPEYGGWYTFSQQPVFHGLSTDIPLSLPQAIARAV